MRTSDVEIGGSYVYAKPGDFYDGKPCKVTGFRPATQFMKDSFLVVFEDGGDGLIPAGDLRLPPPAEGVEPDLTSEG